MSERPGTSVFPFLVGSGRSGTTLVRVMLDSGSDLTIPPEAFFALEPQASWLQREGTIDVGSAVGALEGEAWYGDWNLPAGAFADTASKAAPTSYPELIRCLFRTYAESQGKPRYGSKTPQHVLSIRELSAMFPEARFIHIMRDGRDVASSFLEVHFGPNDVESAARLWMHRVKQGRVQGQALGDARYLELRYEDLLADPEAELRRLCAFIDLAYEDRMLRYHERDPIAVAGVGDRYYHHNTSMPPTEGLRDWRHQMSRADILLFESIAGETLDAFGYERGGIVPSSADLMGVRLRRSVAKARRRTRAIRRLRGRIVRRVRDA